MKLLRRNAERESDRSDFEV